MKVTAEVVAYLVSLVIPLAVGLVTRLNASSQLKAIVLMFLSAAMTVIVAATLSDGTAIISKPVVTQAILDYAISVAAYLGVLRHTVSPPLNRATANIGIGGSATVDLPR